MRDCLAGCAWKMTSSRPTSNCPIAPRLATSSFFAMQVDTIGACPMLLAEVDGLETERAGRLAVQAAIDAWQGAPSEISDHGERCCQIARAWLFATDYSQLNAGHHLMGPRSIRQR